VEYSLTVSVVKVDDDRPVRHRMDEVRHQSSQVLTKNVSLAFTTTAHSLELDLTKSITKHTKTCHRDD
jgi:hypothetical protein